MTVTVSDEPVNGSYRICGITNNSKYSALLGRRYFHVGAHWIGFDDNFTEPVVVRAYYDPSDDSASWEEASRLKYTGYMQFMQMNFRGMPIPPCVYGGVLAQRQAYVYGDQMMVDFMDPKSASLREIPEPFYPWNGMLLTGISAVEDLYVQPLPNGSLCAYSKDLDPKQSVVASLAAEITASMVDEKVVKKAVSGLTPLATIPVTPEQLANAEAYQIAFDWLKTHPLPPDSPFLAGVEKSQVAAQVVGNYVLMTLPDPEDLGDTLIVSTTASGTQVVVHLLSEYDFVAMSTDAARDALWRIKEYQLSQDRIIGGGIDRRPTGRGLSGLTTPPYSLSAADYSLELKFWTVAAGVRQRVLRSSPGPLMLSCLKWSALFQFSEDTGLMTLTAIREPTLAESFDLNAGVAQYIKARDAAAKIDSVIDTSNFTKAAMTRDNFAAGNKLSFVNASGTKI